VPIRGLPIRPLTPDICYPHRRLSPHPDAPCGLSQFNEDTGGPSCTLPENNLMQKPDSTCRQGWDTNPGYFRTKWGYPEGPVDQPVIESPGSRRQCQGRLSRCPGPADRGLRYVGASTCSLPDLAVEVAANVRATTSLAIGLGQTTDTRVKATMRDRR